MFRLSCQPLTAAAFAPFGQLVGIEGKTPEPINAGSTRRYAELARLDIRGHAGDGDPVLHLYVADARRFPLPLERLERHRLASQAFLPLNKQQFIVVVAPGAEQPEWERIQAFLSAPGQGVVLHRGCWHHGLIALNDGDRFAVIEGGAYRSDTEECCAPRTIALDPPAILPG